MHEFAEKEFKKTDETIWKKYYVTFQNILKKWKIQDYDILKEYKIEKKYRVYYKTYGVSQHPVQLSGLVNVQIQGWNGEEWIKAYTRAYRGFNPNRKEHMQLLKNTIDYFYVP